MRDLTEREVPKWVVVTAAAVVLLTVGYLGSKAITERAADPGPPKKVYPGMYDLRGEAARMRATQQNQARPYGR